MSESTTQHFPTMMVDNFYESPEEVLSFAKSLDYAPASDSNWPGERTEHIAFESKALFDMFGLRLFSNFFNLHQEPISWEIETYFQKITPYDDPSLNEGWVHVDSNCLFGGVIYLNEGEDVNAGTSLWNTDMSVESIRGQTEYRDKEDFYAHGGKGRVSAAEYVAARQRVESRFTQTGSIGQKFNRLVMFPWTQPHKANAYSANGETRLTQVFFVNKVEAPATPRMRMDSYAFSTSLV